MKTRASEVIRTLSLGIALLVTPAAFPVVAATERTTDAAALQLAATGAVPIAAFGPYVEVGTYQIQVAAKLGRPDARLPDGTWLYHNRTVANSDTRGTVVVRFAGKRVSRLSLVTPATALAMIDARRAIDPARMVSTR